MSADYTFCAFKKCPNDSCRRFYRRARNDNSCYWFAVRPREDGTCDYYLSDKRKDE